jgi:hypothetical protein
VCIEGMMGRGTWGDQVAPGPSGWSCSGRLGRCLERRTAWCQGARVRMTDGRDRAKGVKPPGGRVSHGGPCGGRGRARITTSTPWPPGGHGGPARRGGHQQSGGGLSRAGAVGGGTGACPASASWRWCRRGRWTGLHSPSYRTVWKPGGHTCGRQRRIHAWAGRVMVCPREDGES